MHKISTLLLALAACSQPVTCRNIVGVVSKTDFPIPLSPKDGLSTLSVICMVIPQNLLVPLSTCSHINSLVKPKMNKRQQTNDTVSIVSSNEPQNKYNGSENEAQEYLRSSNSVFQKQLQTN